MVVRNSCATARARVCVCYERKKEKEREDKCDVIDENLIYRRGWKGELATIFI